MHEPPEYAFCSRHVHLVSEASWNPVHFLDFMMDGAPLGVPLIWFGFGVSIAGKLFRKGWSVDDYRRSIDLLLQVWERWMPWIAAPVLIGLGSVCRRHLADPRHGLFAILEGLEAHLPSGCKLHLFGVKGQALERVKMYDWVASVDSMAPDFAARVKARQAGTSNTIAHRAAEMDRWMRSASRRAAPAVGDQFRLAFNA
ncbi:hypothetical protein [Paraburkholderia sp. BL6669N2]|uniref:deazapurine DNA modification protein DpdA family protein n=1 Tax=Paraburkholderia sp. BL6669N2 TaxID=1938807 RepID=UPI0015F24C2D|nr:hypothetical protein [Paraburkholderia sp. BL6669N2]